MPYATSLKRYSFVLTQKTELIIEIFKKACDAHFKLSEKEEGLSGDLAIGVTQKRKGFISKILNAMENFNEKKYGSSYTTLNAIEFIKLDPKADKIIDEFSAEINSLFLKQGYKTQHLNQVNDIESPALVFRILLLRLLTLALCDDNTFGRDGEVLLSLYTHFIDQVLNHIDVFKADKEIFSYFSSKEHLEWVNSVRQIVFAVKLIHSHRDTLTECLTILKTISANIQRMILANLVIADGKSHWPSLSVFTTAPKIKPADLDEAFIEAKLNEYEKYLSKKNPHKIYKEINEVIQAIDITTFASIEHLDRSHTGSYILDKVDFCENPQIAALIACKNNECPEKLYQKLQGLYALYFKTRCLLVSLEQLDDIITTCSWVPLITGAINLSQLCQLIRLHCNACSDLLAIPNNDLVNELPFNHTILQKSFHGQMLLTKLYDKVKSLEELQDPVKIEKIKFRIEQNIKNIIEVQSALEICLLQYNGNKEKITDAPPKPAIAHKQKNSQIVMLNTENTAFMTKKVNTSASTPFRIFPSKPARATLRERAPVITDEKPVLGLGSLH